MTNEQSALSKQGDATLVEMNKLHDLADRTECELEIAIDGMAHRYDQLDILLDRSETLLHQNQTFGIGLLDYRKNVEQKIWLNKMKFIAMGIVLLVVILLLTVLNLTLKKSEEKSRSITIE